MIDRIKHLINAQMIALETENMNAYDALQIAIDDLTDEYEVA